MTAMPRIPIDHEALANFCQRHHIKRLAFFGSVLRDDFGPESDVDVLYEFEPGHVPGYRLVEIVEELSTLLGGRAVDMVSFDYINPHLRTHILAEAAIQYEAA
jgi:predicted nucleotidyltransferase